MVSAVFVNRCVYFLMTILLFPCTVFAENSPYKLSLAKDVTLISVGAAFNVTNYFIADYHSTLKQQDLVLMSRSDVNWFDRRATYNWSLKYDSMSNVTRDVVFFMPLSLLLSDYIRQDILTISVLYIETWLIANGVKDCLKSITGRPRPYVYNEDVDDEIKMTRDAIRSFPSGHTTIAFFSGAFFATVFSDYYPKSEWKLPVWIASLSIAVATGYFRYKAGKHYPTDILAGAVIGGVAGYGVPYLHKECNNVAIVPTGDGIHIGIMMAIR
jgi:membrane-associated phospholipid phosphatase